MYSNIGKLTNCWLILREYTMRIIIAELTAILLNLWDFMLDINAKVLTKWITSCVAVFEVFIWGLRVLLGCDWPICDIA